jgi:hypothetical protein
MIAETALGSVEGQKFQPEKGDLVRIVATEPNDGSYVLFIDGTLVDHDR